MGWRRLSEFLATRSTNRPAGIKLDHLATTQPSGDTKEIIAYHLNVTGLHWRIFVLKRTATTSKRVESEQPPMEF